MRTTSAFVAAVAGLALAGGAALAVEGRVSGKFLGNGKEATLAHAVAVPEAEKWQGDDAWSVVLTERAPEPGSKPEWDAGFGKLGSALVVRVTRKGELYGAEVYHAALEHKPFSTSGPIQIDQFRIEGDAISGHLFTREPDDFFGDRWELDLTFTAPLAGAK